MGDGGLPLVCVEVVQPLDDAPAFLAVARVDDPVEDVRRALRLADVRMREELERLGRRQTEGRQRLHDVPLLPEQAEQPVHLMSTGLVRFWGGRDSREWGHVLLCELHPVEPRDVQAAPDDRLVVLDLLRERRVDRDLARESASVSREVLRELFEDGEGLLSV